MADAAKTATTMPSAPSRVRSSARIRAMVTAPTVSVAGSMSPRLARRSSARVIRLDPSASYPVNPSSWPSTMFTPTALMNPIMTDWDT